ncbi:hypothetical protein [Oribacterium sp. FC2011]|uniref:hypothetical protein n=1 Tax=Oribacterium sp. FC2011 TaxID=1408311 RepID=UPI0004E0E4E0|nr:hypothetical protein [Oribacterium sp. FC2011]
MRKNIKVIAMALVLAGALAACDNAAGVPEAASTQAETPEQTETSVPDESAEKDDTAKSEKSSDEEGSSEANEKTADSEKGASNELVGLANPWRDITYDEAFEVVAKLFKAPEGATNEKWSICESVADPSGVPGPLVQLSFDLDGMSYTAREQVTGDNAEDISGMYFEWTSAEDITLASWADGQMEGKYYRYIGEKECADVITWYDIEYGASYSLSVTAEDLDGFDLQAVAEAMYDPSTQPGFNAPDEEEQTVK